MSSLAVERNVAVSTQDQAFYALLFLYNEILEQPLDHVANVVRSRKPKRLPEVFSEAEIVPVMGQLKGKAWLQAMLMYGGGLRVGHMIRLRVKDLKFDSLQVYVRRPKGRNDYVTLMAKSVVEPLREHLEAVRQLHEKAMREGYGGVRLPYALRGNTRKARPRGIGSLCSRLGDRRAIRKRGRSGGIMRINRTCRNNSRRPCAGPGLAATVAATR